MCEENPCPITFRVARRIRDGNVAALLKQPGSEVFLTEYLASAT